MNSFLAESRMAHALISGGKRDSLPHNISSSPLPEAGVDLSIACQPSTGRIFARDFVHVNGIDCYGEAHEVFAFGLICWKLSTREVDQFDYPICLSSSFGGDVKKIRVLGSNRAKKSGSVEAGKICRLTPIPHPIRPLEKMIRSESDLPSFGIRDSDKNADGSVNEKEMVLRQSNRGLNAFGRCLMMFAASNLSEMEELHFEHGHLASTSSVGRISYEANFYKVGSFVGDSIFIYS